MKNGKIRALVLALALILMMGMMASCGNNTDNTQDNQNNQSANDQPAEEEVVGDVKVTLSIDFPDSSDQSDVENAPLGLPAEQSVLDALYAYSNNNNIDVQVQEGETIYVESIGGVAAEGNSGWVYEVNDEEIMESAATLMVKDGDKIQWKYVTF